ncbi:MAG: sigma-70 family RNA polymerase sigma factor, partial [Verrucomicrobia bacterium]|nr:sigma-70 family RNA polymerase sigma factor [Verrucomicrobiota bacterium]
RKTGIPSSAIYPLLNFKRSPIGRGGELIGAAAAISKALHCLPEELFPDHLRCAMPVNQLSDFVERAQLSAADAMQMLGPGDEAERAEMEHTVAEVMGELNEQERAVLKGRFWDDESLEEIGEREGLSRERVRQVEAKALRRLRHPCRAKRLEEICAFPT